ncbi:MAG TPA: MlaD family protein, partial [Thermoleophilaceae bacterium]|nr:MlaD family protein [Thermoleophilaceae bacterium]
MSARKARRAMAVASLIVAIAAIAIVLTRSDGATYEVRATFDDVRGLIEGGDVRAGAVPVGKVTKIEIGPGERPLVTMAIDDDFRLRQGATADIRLASNVGAVNRTVELEQGDEGAPRLRDGARLRGGQTDQPVNFDEVMDSLTPRARRDIANLLGGLEAGTRDRGPDIDRTLRHSALALGNTAALLAEVNQDGQALRTIVGDGERVVSSLASRPGDLGATAERLAGLLDATAARRAELGESVRLLGPALADGRRTLDAVAAATPELRRL